MSSITAGLSPELLRAAVWVFLFGLWVASRDLPVRYALLITGIKVIVPVAYFAHNATGVLHLSDDVAYFNSGIALMRLGFDPLSIFTDPRGLPALMSVAGTRKHIAYHLWNLFGMSFFGPHYFSPVFLNVGLTFVSGWFFFRILRSANFSVPYSRFGLAFFLLHWDTLVWSSFLNLKDTLVVTLTLALLHQFVMAFQRPRVWQLLPVALLAMAGLFLRFYAPLLVLGAVFIHFAFRKKGWRIGVLVLGAVLALAWASDLAMAGWARVRSETFLQGLPQFLLTPLPWNLSAGYEFLLLPSILHLVLIVPALLAVPSLWNRNPQARLFLIYLLLVVLAFSVVPENRGIRQRQMASFVFVWLQFHALWAFARYALDPGRKLADPSAPQGDPAG